MLARETLRAVFDTADRDVERGRETLSPVFLATITLVEAGIAADGNALVSVSWKGSVTESAGYMSQYTPQVGDRVLCVVLDDQPVIVGAVIGYSNPPEE